MLLNLIFFLIVLVFLLVFFLPSNNYKEIRSLALSCSGLIVGFSLLLLNFFNNNLYHFQSLTVHKIGFEFLNLYFFVGLDGISLFFFVLSNFLVFLCLLFVWDEKYLKEYVLVLISLDFFLLLVFSVLDIIFFYIFFESILIPMYLMIGFWGSRERKIRAVYLFFFYTLLGSLCTLLGLL
jgi:NADH-ubiquinone oxidoreductase chain 4